MNPPDAQTDQLDRLRLFFLRTSEENKVSAQTAAVISLLSLAGCYIMIYLPEFTIQVYVLGWISIFVLCGAAASYFYWVEAIKHGEKPYSEKTHVLLSAMTPPLVVWAVVTYAAMITPYHIYFTTVLWMLFYGLTLQSIAVHSFWPVRVLGWAFLLTGMILNILLSLPVETVWALWDIDTNRAAPWLMGWTFGLFHAIYAGCIWSMSSVPLPRRTAEAL